MDQLDQFIKEIIDAKNLPGITDDAKAGLLEEMRDGLMDKINRALIEALPESKIGEFNQLFDTPDVSDEQVQMFIEQSGVDTQKITAQTMLQFRSLYLQNSAERSAA